MTKTSKAKPAASADNIMGTEVGNLEVNAANGTSPGSELKAGATPLTLLKPTPAAKPASKQQKLAALVVRDEGATLDRLIAATGWLPHTTRAALTGLKKKGFVISSDKVDGVRTYRGIPPE